jgi:predicted RNA-binding Zn-ribbon protein involved in translation (DUF1610 family)
MDELGDTEEFRSLYHDLFFNLLGADAARSKSDVQFIACCTRFGRPLHRKRTNRQLMHITAPFGGTRKIRRCHQCRALRLSIAGGAAAVSHLLCHRLGRDPTLQRYAATKHRSIAVIPHRQLAHLDRANLTTKKLEEICPVFVDLWLVSHGNCSSVGDGGFESMD